MATFLNINVQIYKELMGDLLFSLSGLARTKHFVLHSDFWTKPSLKTFSYPIIIHLTGNVHWHLTFLPALWVSLLVESDSLKLGG